MEPRWSRRGTGPGQTVRGDEGQEARRGAGVPRGAPAAAGGQEHTGKQHRAAGRPGGDCTRARSLLQGTRGSPTWPLVLFWNAGSITVCHSSCWTCDTPRREGGGQEAQGALVVCSGRRARLVVEAGAGRRTRRAGAGGRNASAASTSSHFRARGPALPPAAAPHASHVRRLYTDDRVTWASSAAVLAGLKPAGQSSGRSCSASPVAVLPCGDGKVRFHITV